MHRKPSDLRHFLILTFFLLCLLTPTPSAAQQLAVLSDIHLLAPELIQPGNAIERVSGTDAKLVQASDALMAYATDTLLSAHPDLLLISGDLTFNGERASHLRLISHLQRLQQAGIAVCVVPGNHDILNPYARAFMGDSTQDTDTISAEDFALLYQDFGYSQQRDTASLSYACSPLPGLMVLGIDSNRYTENQLRRRGDERDENLTAGHIRPETLRWLCDRAIEARDAGQRVVALMHHHLVEHFDGEGTLLPRYIIPDAEAAAAALATAGVRVIFTGHLHITDAVRSRSASSVDSTITITDVATGSLTTFPFPVRMAELSRDGRLHIHTRFLHPADSILTAGQTQLQHGVTTIANMVATRIWERFGKQLSDIRGFYALFGDDPDRLPADSQALAQLLLQHMRPTLLRCIQTVTRGNEPVNDPDILEALHDSASSALTSMLPAAADEMAQELLHSVWPRLLPQLTSIFKDVNQAGFSTQTQTDDHQLDIQL